jgi:hypothetical protein
MSEPPSHFVSLLVG